MVNITNIVHGDANWDESVNANFNALNSDTGWLPLVLFAPASSGADSSTAPAIRKINGRVQLIGNVKITNASVSNVLNGLRIATFPNGFYPDLGWVFGSIPFIPNGGTCTCHVSGDGIFIHDSFSDTRVIDLGAFTYLSK